MYKNFIFDMGNVLVDFSPDYILSRYTLKPELIEYLKAVIFGGDAWKKLDNGDISFEASCQLTKDAIPVEYHEICDSLYATWHHHKLPRLDMLEIVKRLKGKGYGIYLCSNAASLFHTYKDRYEVFQYFDDLVISADIKISKPDARIYDYVLSKNNLDPSTCLFIDDIAENIKGAKDAGIAGYHYNGNCAMFESYLMWLEIL